MAQPAPQKKKGLTYGRLLIVLGAAIALAGIAAGVQSLLIANHFSFAEISYELLGQASYDRTEITSAELVQHRGGSGKIQGTVLYVKTNEGNYAKLAVEFSHRFWSPKLQFAIYQLEVFDKWGRPLRLRSNSDKVYNAYIQLHQRYDLDAGLTLEEGASEAGVDVDLAFVERSVADQSVLAVNGAALALPKLEELKK